MSTQPEDAAPAPYPGFVAIGVASGLVFAVMLLAATAARANDAAAETAAGGIRLREERRVAMTKERLTISKAKASRGGGLDDRHHVAVEYEFQVVSGDRDVASEVAFPLPEYKYGYFDIIGTRRVAGFEVQVDGKRISVEKEVRATVEGRDVTGTLADLGIEIETFGGYRGSASDPAYQVARLTEAQRERLRAEGLLGADVMGEPLGGGPTWKVAVTYHWRQVFPAGRVLRVRHDYDAIAGAAYNFSPIEVPGDDRGPPTCSDQRLLEALGAAQRQQANGQGKPAIFKRWVSYILTTANSWRTPIDDFELVVDFPPGEFATFCWDGPIERVSPTRLRARKRDFVPAKEVAVFFLHVGRP